MQRPAPAAQQDAQEPEPEDQEAQRKGQRAHDGQTQAKAALAGQLGLPERIERA